MFPEVDCNCKVLLVIPEYEMVYKHHHLTMDIIVADELCVKLRQAITVAKNALKASGAIAEQPKELSKKTLNSPSLPCQYHKDGAGCAWVDRPCPTKPCIPMPFLLPQQA
jgi:hypothetical protein